MLLDEATRKQLTEVCVAEAKKATGLAMIVVHVGHARTDVALELALHAKEAGASAGKWRTKIQYACIRICIVATPHAACCMAGTCTTTAHSP